MPNDAIYYLYRWIGNTLKLLRSKFYFITFQKCFQFTGLEGISVKEQKLLWHLKPNFLNHVQTVTKMNFSTILECCVQFIDLGSNNCVNSMKSYTLNTLFSMCKPSKKQHFDAYSTPWKYSYYLLNKRLVNWESIWSFL